MGCADDAHTRVCTVLNSPVSAFHLREEVTIIPIFLQQIQRICKPCVRSFAVSLVVYSSWNPFLCPGNEAFKTGKWKEAIEGYTRAIDIDPDNKVRNRRLDADTFSQIFFPTPATPCVFAGLLVLNETLGTCQAACLIDGSRIRIAALLYFILVKLESVWI